MIKEFGRDPHDSGRPIDLLSAVDQGTVLAPNDAAIYGAEMASPFAPHMFGGGRR
jgi:hypothetical protein